MTSTFNLAAIAVAISLLACGPSDTPETTDDSLDLSSSYALDPNQVPEHLRHLLPLANKWGIGDDIDRMEYIERSSADDRDALAAAIAPYHAEITTWLDSFGSNALSDEAAAFMYMQLALEEMP